MYAFALLKYPDGYWGFIEPFLYRVGINERFCLVLGDVLEIRSGVSRLLEESFEEMWTDGQSINRLDP